MPAALAGGFAANATLTFVVLAIAHRILPATEGSAMKHTLNRTIEALVLIRLGQELGTDSDIAQAIAGGIDCAVRFVGVFCP